MLSELEGKKPTEEMLDFPSVDEGIRGMAFIDHVVASSESNEKWTKYTV